jgi:hypothetical protein
MLKHIHDMTMAQPIRLPRFRRLFVGESIAVFADQMLLVALTLWLCGSSAPVSRSVWSWRSPPYQGHC